MFHKYILYDFTILQIVRYKSYYRVFPLPHRLIFFRLVCFLVDCGQAPAQGLEYFFSLPIPDPGMTGLGRGLIRPIRLATPWDRIFCHPNWGWIRRGGGGTTRDVHSLQCALWAALPPPPWRVGHLSSVPTPLLLPPQCAQPRWAALHPRKR